MLGIFCPCYPASVVGGWIGGYFGISPPDRAGGKIFSAWITANLVSITMIALDSMFKISLCAGTGFNLGNVFRVLVKTIAMGIIYSIGVNYLLTCYVLPPKRNQEAEILQDNQQKDKVPYCCCKDKQ